MKLKLKLTECCFNFKYKLPISRNEVSVRVSLIFGESIDPMQKWLPLNYSFVYIQNSPTNLVRNKKFFRIFVSKTRLVGLF